MRRLCALPVILFLFASTPVSAQQLRSHTNDLPEWTERVRECDALHASAITEINAIADGTRRMNLRILADRIRTDGLYSLKQSDAVRAISSDVRPLLKLAMTTAAYDLAFFVDADEYADRIEHFEIDSFWAAVLSLGELVGDEVSLIDLASLDETRLRRYLNTARRMEVDKPISGEHLKQLASEFPLLADRAAEVAAGKHERTRKHSRIRSEMARRSAVAHAAATRSKFTEEFSEHSRTWTSKDGKFSTTAVYLSFDDGIVKLVKSDQETIDVPVTKLSDDDRIYISKIKRRKIAAPVLDSLGS